MQYEKPTRPERDRSEPDEGRQRRIL